MHLSATAIRSQKRASDALALELEGVVCCPAWVLGAELGSSNLRPATASKGTAWEILMGGDGDPKGPSYGEPREMPCLHLQPKQRPVSCSATSKPKTFSSPVSLIGDTETPFCRPGENWTLGCIFQFFTMTSCYHLSVNRGQESQWSGRSQNLLVLFIWWAEMFHGPEGSCGSVTGP